VPTGYGNKLGNKGGVIIRLNVDSTSIVIMGCHLTAGKNKNQGRIKDIKTIITNAFQDVKVGQSNRFNVQTADYKFFLGDLNFRLNLSR